MSQDQTVLVRRLVEDVISKGDLALIDTLLTPDYRYHAPSLEVSGPKEMAQVFAMLRGGFSDWGESLEDLIAEGDLVGFRVVGRGTHDGDFMGIPATGKTVAINGLDLVRIEGDRIAEHWASFDQLGMLQQLGVIPAGGR